MWLTDEQILLYKRCRRRAYLNVHGDFNQRDPEADFLRKLHQDSLAHHRRVLASTSYEQPDYRPGDWEAGAEATQQLMKQGVERIYKGVLLVLGEVTYLSQPDLLIKQPGESEFGNWMYAPTSIKLGIRPKPEYQLVSAFQAYVLAMIQGVLPEVSWLILRRQNLYAVQLERWVPQMQSILKDCQEMLQDSAIPEVFISRQRCGLCQWYGSCYAIAQSQKHLSLLPGVTPSRYQFLKSLKLTTVEALASATIPQLEAMIEPEIAQVMIQQAQSQQQNQVLLKPDFPLDWQNVLPTATVELFFDIEAEPDREVDYLLGVLVVDKQAKTENFYSFLAEQPEDEGLVWQQFLKLVNQYPDAPIFHYSEYEVDTIKRLGRLYNTPIAVIQALRSRFVDVHAIAIAMATFPVESYSLKALANWLGFHWRDAGITGAQCVCWYDDWLKSGDRSLLASIRRYNEDDCRATRHLKDWLVEFLATP